MSDEKPLLEAYLEVIRLRDAAWSADSQLAQAEIVSGRRVDAARAKWKLADEASAAFRKRLEAIEALVLLAIIKRYAEDHDDEFVPPLVDEAMAAILLTKLA